MIVKNILAGKRGNVVTIEPTTDLAAVVKLLAERRIGAVVILGADHRIVGILSERDIMRSLAEHGPTALIRSQHKRGDTPQPNRNKRRQTSSNATLIVRFFRLFRRGRTAHNLTVSQIAAPRRCCD